MGSHEEEHKYIRFHERNTGIDIAFIPANRLKHIPRYDDFIQLLGTEGRYRVMRVTHYLELGRLDVRELAIQPSPDARWAKIGNQTPIAEFRGITIELDFLKGY